MTILQPMILGTGQAGKALASACQILSGTSRWKGQLTTPLFLERGTPLNRSALSKLSQHEPLLLLANPQGLHAKSLLEALKGDVRYLCVEKPAAVRIEELLELEQIAQPVGVFHGYRQLWGAQKLREFVAQGKFGEVFAADVRYWQSSAAQRAISKDPATISWKNDPSLLGPYDAYLDLGCHAVDLVQHILGETPNKWNAQLSYVNAEAKHRDTQAYLDTLSAKGTSIHISVSKTIHGFGNELEIIVAGTKGSGRWRFQDPDHLILGEGTTQTTLYRPKSETEASEFPPGHGLGWLEGYIATLNGYLTWMKQGRKPEPLPGLAEHLAAIRALLTANIHISQPSRL